MKKQANEKALKFWAEYVGTAERFAWPGLILGLASGLVFLILYRVGSMAPTMMAGMIIGFSLAALFVIAVILLYVGRAYLKRYYE